MAVIKHLKLKVRQLNVKSAILHGNIKENLYMKIRKGVYEKGDNKVCKLLKSLYGLKQAPYEWNTKFNDFCEKHDLKKDRSLIHACT